MKNVRIVFSDLDNTLTTSPGVIDIENKKAIKRLKEKDILVVINTGRALNYIVPIAKDLSTSNYVIASNGAEIYDFENNKSIYHNELSKKSLEELDVLINKYDLFFMANSGLYRYTNKKDKSDDFIQATGVSDLKNICQIVLESYSIENMKKVKEELSKDLIIANQTKHVKENKLLYYDIVNKDVSKGIAINILCNYLNIPVEYTMGIGDSGNDIEMLKTAHYKVAVGNATDDLKSVANIVTLSNKENGVAKVLNELYESIN